MTENKPHYLVAGKNMRTKETRCTIYAREPTDRELEITYAEFDFAVYRFSSKQDAQVAERAVMDWSIPNIIRRIG